MEHDAPPFYSSAANEKGDSYGYNALFHLVKGDRKPEGAYAHVIPFYFHCEEEPDSSFTLVPPFYYHRESLFEEDSFFLLWGKKKRGNRTDLYPFFPLIRFTTHAQAAHRWEAFLFPLLDLTRDGKRHRLKVLDLSVLLGIFQLLDYEWGIPAEEGGGSGGAFSFFNVLNMIRIAGGGSAGGYDDFQFLSLFSNEKLSLFQRHWSKSGEGKSRTVLFPFYWHLKDDEGEALHFWPLYGWEEAVEGDWKRHVLYPFLSFEKDPGRGRWALDFPWPLVRIAGGEGADFETRLLPFYWAFAEKDRSLRMVAPFYAGYEDGAGYARRFYTPFFSRYTGPGESEWGLDLLFPLFSHQKAADRSHDRLLPFYYMTFEKEAHTVALTPLFWSTRNDEGYAFDLLFPLYAHFGLGEEDHTYSVLPIFKLLADRPSREKPGRSQVDLLWPLALYRSMGQSREGWIFPFFSHESGPGLVRWGVLADLFSFKAAQSRKTLTLFWFIPISWGGVDESPSEESKS